MLHMQWLPDIICLTCSSVRGAPALQEGPRGRASSLAVRRVSSSEAHKARMKRAPQTQYKVASVEGAGDSMVPGIAAITLCVCSGRR